MKCFSPYFGMPDCIEYVHNNVSTTKIIYENIDEKSIFHGSEFFHIFSVNSTTELKCKLNIFCWAEKYVQINK